MLWKDPRCAAYGAYVIILTLACIVPLLDLARFAFHEELHSHILLIPLVSIYLASHKLPALHGSRHGSVAASVASALALGGLSAVLLLVPQHFGKLSADQDQRMMLFAAGYALLLAAGGFLILGANRMRGLAFPFALLAFMIPLPHTLVAHLEYFLMRASAEAAHWLFQWTGTPVFRTGQVMELPGMTLEVASSCSGVRSTLVLLITSLIAAHMFLSSNVHRFVMVAIVIPLGILRNAVRVLVIGLLCVHIRPEMIDSWIHRRGGPVFFAASLVPLLALAVWFRRREMRRSGAASSGAAGRCDVNNPGLPSPETQTTIPQP